LNGSDMSVETEFWQNCARLIEVYPDRPEKYTGESEPVTIERQLKLQAAAIAKALCNSEHWRGSASVGKGNWTNLPWVAFFDERESTSAQNGVYPVIHMSCDEPVGMRLGLGVAATEFQDNPEAKAKQVHEELSDQELAQLREAHFIDVVQGDQQRVPMGAGKLAIGYARGMIFERFVPLDELRTAASQLSDALRTLLNVYKTWADRKHGSRDPRPHFLEVMRAYANQHVVFLSPNRQVRYLISDVDDEGCVVQRLDAQESERVTTSAYQAKCKWLGEQGGRANRADLDNTVAKHICYLQGPDLGLSSDRKEAVLLDDVTAAIDQFISLLENLASPQLYKPVILALVIEAIGTGDLRENWIEFDWLVPRFIERMKQHGKEVTEQQAAEGFGRLAGDLFWLLAHRDPQTTLSADKPTANQIRDRISHAVIKQPYWHALQLPKQRSRVLAALARKWWPEMNIEGRSARVTGLAEATQQLIANIARAGYIFQPWQIAAYVTALRTKPFVILAGVSGTGKSKLPMQVAELTGGSRPRRVAVRPDWTDSSDVMGYVDLQGRFRPGVVLQELRVASTKKDDYHVCLVDEMNLARVEHYFAEFLSAIEDRRAAAGGGYDSSPILTQTLSDDPEEWQYQCIPANVAIVGTVNMDESTHGFSRKVLDRAFTLELSEVDLRWVSSEDDRSEEEKSPSKWPLSYWHCRASRIRELDGSDPAAQRDVQTAIDTLEHINRVLRYSQLQVGYRTRDEVALFLINARDVTSSFVTRDNEPVDPLDLVVMMKILPRIVGGSNSIRRTLLGLLGFAKDGTPLKADDDPAEIIRVWESDGRPAAYTGARFPRTAGRLCLMWERLEVEGYTSFWL
jgi:MoxR-like ATPase